jgi:hypothetical protein
MMPNPEMAKREMAKSQSSQPQPVELRREHTNLSYRYGTIGIDAVAAAVRYAGSRKNPAYAPVAHRTDQRFLEPAI